MPGNFLSTASTARSIVLNSSVVVSLDVPLSNRSLGIEDVDSLMVFHSILKVTHLGRSRVCFAMARVERNLVNELTRIEGGGKRAEAHYGPLHPLSEASIWAIPRWGVFIPPVGSC